MKPLNGSITLVGTWFMWGYSTGGKSLVSFMGTGSGRKAVWGDIRLELAWGCLSWSGARCPLSKIVDHCGCIMEVMDFPDRDLLMRVPRTVEFQTVRSSWPSCIPPELSLDCH